MDAWTACRGLSSSASAASRRSSSNESAPKTIMRPSWTCSSGALRRAVCTAAASTPGEPASTTTASARQSRSKSGGVGGGAGDASCGRGEKTGSEGGNRGGTRRARGKRVRRGPSGWVNRDRGQCQIRTADDGRGTRRGGNRARVCAPPRGDRRPAQTWRETCGRECLARHPSARRACL